MREKYYLYVLSTLDFIYVGITTRNPVVRWREHLNGNGGKSTAKTKIISILDLEVYENITKQEAEELENQKVKNLMAEFGSNNVVGGKYTKEASNLD